MELGFELKKQDQLCLWAPVAPTLVQGNRLSAVATGYRGGHFWASAGNCGAGGVADRQAPLGHRQAVLLGSRLQIRGQTTCLW